MARTARKKSALDLYHVMGRGVGKCIIFESDDDRHMFVRLLRHSTKSNNITIHAWCLMDNHYHLVVGCDLDRLSVCMKSLNAGYANYFNEAHGRIGHLFQGRYKSQPIDSEAQLLCAVRYVHQNPLEAGITTSCRYQWSSYEGYLDSPWLVDNSLVTSLFDSEEDFCLFHEAYGFGAKFIDIDHTDRSMPDDRLIQIARFTLRGTTIEEVHGLPRDLRDAALRSLRQANLSLRQIERLTGVPKSVVARA